MRCVFCEWVTDDYVCIGCLIRLKTVSVKQLISETQEKGINPQRIADRIRLARRNGYDFTGSNDHDKTKEESKI